MAQEPVTIQVSRNPKGGMDARIHIDDVMAHSEVLEAIIREIVARVAQKYVDETYPVIARALDPQAIANLALAEAGAAVSRSLKEKLPEKVLVVEKPGTTEVYQRGIFGSLTRIR